MKYVFFRSYFIPVYNEEKRILKTIDSIFDFFSKIKEHKIELIFVNDGSVDKTKDLLNSYNLKYSFKIVSYEQNQGKGYAIREGVKVAQGDWIIFFDIDLATPLAEFDHLLNFMEAKDEVVIGSRRLQESKITKSESNLRVFLGQGFTKLSNILVPGIKDFTCGFKCFKKSAAQKIFPVARINRWGFDTELLYIAKLKNIPVRQMAVQWSHDNDSRVNVFKAVINSFKELLEMKINQIKGLYK